MTDLTPETVRALRNKLASQIGDDVQQIYDHEALFKASRDLTDAFLAQAEEIERLRKRIEAAERLADEASMYRDEYGHNSLNEAVADYRATEERG